MNRKNYFITFFILCLSVILLGSCNDSNNSASADTDVKNKIIFKTGGLATQLTNIENFDIIDSGRESITFSKDGKKYTVFSFYTYIEYN